MLKKIFLHIEETSVSIYDWFAAILAIVVIRAFFENFVGLRPESGMTSGLNVMVHFFLFWVVTLLIVTVVVHLGTKRSLMNVNKITLFGMLAIFIAPLFEFVMTKGEGVQMAYLIVDTKMELLRNFVTFWYTSPAPGVTAGMRIEIFIILLVVYAYSRYCTCSRLRSLVTAFAVYSGIFILLALPSFVSVEASYSWLMLTKNTLFGENLVNPMYQLSSNMYIFDAYFDGVLSQVLYLVSIPISLLFVFLWDAKKSLVILKNSRPERVFHYFMMIGLGIFIAVLNSLSPLTLSSWLDGTTLIILFASFYFAWMYSVGANDIVDCQADSITNPKRPLVSGQISLSETKSANFIFLLMAVLGGFLVGHEALSMLIVFIGIYHIYSCPPFRLKRFALINPFLVSLAALAAVLAGYFTFSKSATFSSFPVHWTVSIVLIITLFSNIKDIKDMVGDKKAGVYTIPVIFGDKTGRLIIWGLISAGLVYVVISSGNSIFWFPSLLASAASWFVIKKEPFVEKWLFMTYFLYAFSLALIYAFA